MRILKNFRFKYKIIIVIVVIASLSTITGNVINYFYEVKNSKKQMIANTLLQAKLVSENCWFPIEFNYPKEAESALKSFHSIPAIQDAILYTLNDSVFASYHKSENHVHQIPDKLKNVEYLIDGNYLNVKQIVTSKDTVCGYLYIRSVIDWNYIATKRIKLSGGIIFLIIILVVILAFIMQKSILQPIEDLTGQMNKVAETKDYTIQFYHNSNDEIGKLYKGFNSMLAEIHKGEINLKNTFQSLKESEIKWQFAIEGAGDGLWDWNLETNEVFITSQWKSMLGYGENEIKSNSIDWEKLIHPQDYMRSLRELEKHFKGETDVYSNEYRLLCKDGTYKWIQARGKVIEWKENNKPFRFIGTHADITDRKNAEEELLLHRNQLEQLVELRTAELKKATQAAENANKAKTSFLANMSHEIRTPMNAILGYSNILINDNNFTARQKDNLTAIYRSGRHLLGIINDILDISKIEAGKAEIHNNAFNMKVLIHDLKSIFSIKAEEKNIDFEIELAQNIPAFIKADEQKIRQIFTNLLSNAFKFTNHGKIKLQIGIDNPEKNHIVGKVTDTGVGIDTEHLKKIFEPFDRGLNDIATEGTGLGLAIAYNYALLMKGDIIVSSTPGEGSIFTFNFPFEKVSVDYIANEKIEKKTLTIKNNQNHIRILLVDDIETNRDILVQLLKPMGFEIKEAANGMEAIHIFNEWNPHIILMDLVMPMMDGTSALKQIAKLKSEMKPLVIITSAAIVQESGRIELLALADGYIIKPVDEQKLLEAICMHPLVSLEYDKEMNSRKKKGINLNDIKNDIQKIPIEIRDQIFKAANIGYRKELFDFIEIINNISPDLANFYSELIKKMMFNDIAILFKRIDN